MKVLGFECIKINDKYCVPKSKLCQEYKIIAPFIKHNKRYYCILDELFKSIFKIAYNNRNDKINKSDLGYLFYMIFEGKLTSKQIDEISDYGNKISDDHSIYLFDAVTHEFAYPKYNRIIKESLIESISKRSLYDNL